MSETFEIRFDGHAFKVPEPPSREHIQSQMRRRGAFYELDFLQYLSQTAGPDGLILDCGANIGNHTLFFSGVMGRETISFEPVESNRKLLLELIELNGLEQWVTVAPIALGASEGRVALEQKITGNSGSFSVVETVEDSQTKVRIARLDDYLSESGLADMPIALMKVDVEGHEIPLLSGAQTTIAKWKPIIALEMETRRQFKDLRNALESHGYVAVAVYNHTPTVVFSADPAATDRFHEIAKKILRHQRRAEK